LLTLLTLRRLTLPLVFTSRLAGSLAWLALALCALIALTGGLISITLAALGLGLLFLAFLALRALIPLRRLARGLILLATLRLRVVLLTLLRLTLLVLSALARAALRRLGLTILPAGPAGLAAAWHILRRCQGYSR
jgi:hypothetical protein